MQGMQENVPVFGDSWDAYLWTGRSAILENCSLKFQDHGQLWDLVRLLLVWSPGPLFPRPESPETLTLEQGCFSGDAPVLSFLFISSA